MTKGKLSQNNFTGYLEDNRSEKEKENDFLHEELLAGYGADWLSRSQAKKQITKYHKFNQYSTSSCVGNSGALSLGIENEKEGWAFEKLSPAFIYRQRFNQSSEGMYYFDLGKIGRKLGSCKYHLLPTPKTEKAINNLNITSEMKMNALIYKAKNYIFMNKPSMTQIKNVVNGMDKPLVISVFATREEWSKEYPEVIDKDLKLEDAYVRHAVTVLPSSAYKYRGKKYFIIQDSAWFGGENIRYISEDFVKERVRHALYWINLENPNPLPKKEGKISFKYTFTRDLRVGNRGKDVVMLQKALKELGFFTYPKCTGYFGGITKKAVIEFQEHYSNEVLKFFGLTKGTGYVGRTTKAKLHNLMT